MKNIRGDVVKKRYFIFLCLLAIVFLIVNTKEEKSVDAFSQNDFEKAERNAEEIMKLLYKNGVVFKEDVGDGTVYLKRYYCSNVCIDVLSDGGIRYLSDVNDADGEDGFLKWVNSRDNFRIVSESEIYGFLIRRITASGIKCKICIEKDGGRVVAARIIFNN